MVSKQRLGYGYDGFKRLTVPRAPRSIRRRGFRNKLVEDDKLCAFELLAAVAGKLLQESESSVSSNIADGKAHRGIAGDVKYNRRSKDDKSLKLESHDRGSCVESPSLPEISIRECNLLSNFKGVNDSALELAAAQDISDLLKSVDCDIKLGISEGKNGKIKSEIGGSICSSGSYNNKLEDDKNQIGESSTAKTSIVKDPTEECVNTNALINSDSSVKLPLYRDPVKHYNNVKLGNRDDGENSFGYNKFSTRIRPLRPQSRVGHRKIRKMLASKYWKTSSKLKECELYKTRDGMSTYYRYRKGIYTRESFQQVPIKKRKLSDQRFANPYDQDASSDSISTSPNKVTRGEQITTDSHVKFSIKSFKVPELYIEVPESATVGSLKRTVMEAVNAILGSGIRVGIALQGKKVRDDNRTLQQAGISESSTLDNLGFTLEPNFANVSPSTTTKKRPLVLSCDENEQFKRSLATPIIESGMSNISTDTPTVTKLDDAFDNNEFVVPPITAQTNGVVASDSQALVPMFPMNVDALAVVPVSSKPKRSEVSQRRTRRPFSVAEVEGLVEAVEKLGTGRWRDVKMRAFENADHRTYVDLKDKWKTLVHTASIAPQQRRGEPVPQVLLDRVLCAHSYWTQNQPKQHGNGKQVSVVEPLKIEEGVVGA